MTQKNDGMEEVKILMAFVKENAEFLALAFLVMLVLFLQVNI